MSDLQPLKNSLPFALSLSKGCCSVVLALRQAQGERSGRKCP